MNDLKTELIELAEERKATIEAGNLPTCSWLMRVERLPWGRDVSLLLIEIAEAPEVISVFLEQIRPKRLESVDA